MLYDFRLEEVEARILGVLMEKRLTTPDHYPLSGNALTNACNQKSNRSPVMSLNEQEVLESVEELRDKGFVMKMDGGRVRKYGHLFREKFDLLPREEAVLAVLLLRGPQTLGEIRTRCERLYHFDQSEEAEKTLEALTGEKRPWTVKLPMQPGRKEPRYSHLFLGEPDPELSYEPEPVAPRSGSLAAEVSELRQELAQLKEEFASFRAQFD